MTTYGPRFITPPTDDQELNPYRPVWRTLLFEAATLAALALIIYAVFALVHLSVPLRFNLYIAIAILITPCLLWLAFTLRAEYAAIEPRRKLIAVFILTMLVARAIGTPVLDQYFRLDTWLPLSPAINRILGYTLTAGIIQGITKYIILRYTIWPYQLRTRVDGVAYGITTGIGYATILSFQFIIANPTAFPDIVAFHIFQNYALHVATGIVIGYGLSEVRFTNPTPLFMTLTLAISAAITGIAIPIYAGLINSSLSITAKAPISAPKPLFGFGLSLVTLVSVSIIIAGLIRNADRLEREARSDSEE